MKSQSAQPAPAIPLKKPANGPSTPLRNPVVGDPPLSHARAAGVAAPPLVKTRSRKPSVATPPKDLDKIDELDETDPLGVAWHMPGPYDAISKPLKPAVFDRNGGDGAKPKIFVSLFCVFAHLC